jgi:uncharacterized protein YndB with AHSA1/START domain
VIGKAPVPIEGRFPTDVGDLWSVLTDPRRLLLWLGEVEGDLRPGGEFRARYLASGWEGTGHIDACEPLRRMLISTRSPDEPDATIEVTLTADGPHTLLVVEDRGLPVDQLAAYGAGDQIHLEDLAAYLAGRDRCDARARWTELHPAYQDLATSLS